MNIDNKYKDLFNEYANRIRDEKLSGNGECSISVRISDTMFAIAYNVNGKKKIEDKDILAIGLVSVSNDREAELHRLTYLTGKNAKAVIHAFPKYSCAAGDAKVIIPPLLDDMAQIIGPDARYSLDSNDKIMKVLKKRNACMIENNGVITYGRSLDEAYVGCLVLEKSAKCFIDVTVIGKYNKINYLECVLMHFIYQKKYSKLNQKNKQLSNDIGNELLANETFSDREMALRQEVKAAGVRLLQSNLVQGTWGNISIRLDDKHMLITPTGLDYMTLTPEDMVVVNIETMEYKGKHKPSGEKDIHAMLLKNRNDINVVMHSHPTECSAFAAARIDLPLISEEMEKYIGGDAKVSSYALPSTMGLAKATVKAIEGRNACFMANHGMLSVGASVEETFQTCRVMEESARAYIDKLASEKSTNKGDAIDKRIDIFKKKFNI